MKFAKLVNANLNAEQPVKNVVESKSVQPQPVKLENLMAPKSVKPQPVKTAVENKGSKQIKGQILLKGGNIWQINP